MGIQNVIAANKAVQTRARALNARLGCDFFPVLDRAGMETFLRSGLAGARRAGEIQDFDALRLPELDEELVAAVVRENPDTITVLGAELAVEYRAPYYGTVYPPRVTLSREMVQANAWINLPDEGVKLPGGRVVEVVASFGYYATIADADIPQFKAKARERQNQGLWDAWTERPAIVLPDPAVTTMFPELEIVQYGTCVVTGEPLRAFGAVVVNPHRYYSSDPQFVVAWYRSVAEAEQARTAAAARFAELLVAASEELARESAKAEAEAARTELSSLFSRDGWYELEYELRSRAESRRYSYLPSSSAELTAWAAETKATIVSVEAAFVELAQKREAEKRAKVEAEAGERTRLASLLAHECVRDDLDLARRIDRFVQEAIRLRGRDAVCILSEERDAPYGRGRRADAIYGAFNGIDDQRLDWAAGRDIVAAAFWAERVTPQKPKMFGAKVNAPVTPADAKPVEETKVADFAAQFAVKFGGAAAKKDRRK